jgi:hypothetical protein
MRRRHRHRAAGTGGKLKIQHGIIDGLRPILEEMCAWPEVQSITPGYITGASARRGGVRLHATRQNLTGIRAVARSGGAVQEVFLVTTDPVAVAGRIDRKYAR